MSLVGHTLRGPIITSGQTTPEDWSVQVPSLQFAQSVIINLFASAQILHIEESEHKLHL